ncbi:MAG: LysR family transcriptional regulator, partial [Lactococcus sp.]|nr:LysR family transcriptional regulator [Lactococcus sp.]
GVYYYTQRYIEEHDIKQEQVSVHNNEIIVALLKKGYGCSIISERAAQGLDYKRLSEKYQRHFYLMTRDQEPRGELSKLVTWIRRQAKDASSN